MNWEKRISKTNCNFVINFKVKQFKMCFVTSVIKLINHFFLLHHEQGRASKHVQLIIYFYYTNTLY